MSVFQDPNTRGYARVAGCFYLLIAVSGGYAIAYVPSVTYVPNDAAASAVSLVTSRGLFLSSIVGDILMMTAELFVTAMLFLMFRHVNETLSLVAALARFSMVGVMAAMLMFHVGTDALMGEAAFEQFEPDQRAALAGLLLVLHDGGVWVWQIFFSAHLVLLGALILKSKMFPSVIGLGLSIGGLGYLLDSAYAFAFPDLAWLGYVRAGLLLIVTLAEVGLALWLVAMGSRQSRRVSELAS